MTTPQWKYALGTLVRYRSPYGVWHEEPYTVIARTYMEMTHAPAPAVQYCLQPSTLHGEWAIDRPVAGVWEHDLEAMEAPPPPPSPLQEAQARLESALALLRAMTPPKGFAGVWMPQLATQGAANAVAYLRMAMAHAQRHSEESP